MHALEPLKYAFAPGQILMISEPALCMGALWIPYRRDARLMKKILEQGTIRAQAQGQGQVGGRVEIVSHSS